MGKYVNTSGATGNKARQGAATRIANARNAADLLEKAPPMKNKAEYNGGMGKAALSTDEWLSTLVPAKQEVSIGNRYDATCGIPDKSTWLPATFDMIADDYFSLERVHFPGGYFVWHPPHLWQARTAGYRCAMQQVIELSTKPAPATPAQVAALQTGDEIISKEEAALTQADAFKVLEQTDPSSEKAAVNWLVADGFDEVDAKKHWAAWRKTKAAKPEPKHRDNEDVMADALEAKYPIKPETIDGLVEAIEYAVKHSSKPEALTLTDGFYAVEVDETLRIKHPALPDINRTIGVKLVSGIYGRAIQRGEVRSLLLRLKEVNTKKAEARQDAPASVTQSVTKDVTVTPGKRDGKKVKPAPTGKSESRLGDKVYSL